MSEKLQEATMKALQGKLLNENESNEKTIFNNREVLLNFINKYSKYEWIARPGDTTGRAIICKPTINNYDWERQATGFYTQDNTCIYLIYRKTYLEDLSTEQEVKDAIEKIDTLLDKNIKKKKAIKWTYNEDEENKWYSFKSRNYYFNIYDKNNTFVLTVNYCGPDGIDEIEESEYNTLEEAQEAATSIYLSL